MDESEFIREYMALMSCSERSALDVFILQEALAEPPQPAWLDALGLLATREGVEPSGAWTSNIG